MNRAPHGGEPFELGSPADTHELATGLGPKRPSLWSSSLARLLSDLWTLAMALIAATVTARLLGPSGKGFYSTLVLLATAFIQVFGAGLGEAAIVLTGRGRYALQDAASATAACIVPLSVAGVGAFVVVSEVVLEPATPKDRLAVLVAAASVAVMVLYTTVTWFLVALERVVSAAFLAAVLGTVTTTTLWALIGWGGLRADGAVLGGLTGAVVVLLAALVLLRRERLLVRPQWNTRFVRAAASLGVRLQLSSLLVSLTARLDLVLVYRLTDSATAGTYSVALTVGSLVAAVPVAVAYASFARLTSADEAEARELTARLFRAGVAAALLVGAALALVVPVLVPLVFGESYRPAIAPTFFLIPGGVLWSGQWLLCRAAAARERPEPLTLSYTVAFATMLAADMVLIPPLGVTGAGIGSLVASIAGFGTALSYYRRWGWDWADLVPRIADVTALAAALRERLRAAVA